MAKRAIAQSSFLTFLTYLKKRGESNVRATNTNTHTLKMLISLRRVLVFLFSLALVLALAHDDEAINRNQGQGIIIHPARVASTEDARTELVRGPGTARLYITLADGRLLALNAATGRQEWLVSTGPPLLSASATSAPQTPLSAGDDALVPGLDGSLMWLKGEGPEGELMVEKLSIKVSQGKRFQACSASPSRSRSHRKKRKN